MQSKYDVNPVSDGKSNKIFIRENDFGELSRYEKNLIRTIGNIYGIITDPSKDVTFDTLSKSLAALGKNKSDNEKSYLLGILFPEKVKNVHSINPFPVK